MSYSLIFAYFPSQALICDRNSGAAAQTIQQTDETEASRKVARAATNLPACSVDEKTLLEAARAATTPGQTSGRNRNAVSKPRASKATQRVEREARELSTHAEEEEPATEAKDIIGRKIGPFRFTPKQAAQASGGRYGGWEVQCPFHRKNFKSGCRKWFGVCGPTMKDKQECAAAALEWCAAARRFNRQWMHLGFQVDYKAAAAAAITRQNPIFSEDFPVQRCRPDSELDTSDAWLEGDAASQHPGVASEIGIQGGGSTSVSSKQLAAPLRTSLKRNTPSQSKRRRLASPASAAPQTEESADNCRPASSDSSSSSESMSSACSRSNSSSNSSNDSSSSSNAESSSDED